MPYPRPVAPRAYARRSRADGCLEDFPAEAVAEAAALGLTLFGENRVQEFANKSAALGPKRKSMECHLIGHLQSNKAGRAAELFDGIDSLDSLRLAERLDEAAGRYRKRLPVLIEVKLSPEATKAGLTPESAEAAQLLERLPDFSNLNVRGLMTIAPWGAPEDETAPVPQPAHVARPLGRGAPESASRRAVHGHERRFSVGHR